MDKILRQFLAVATFKNVSHAAKKLCLSQPTLTHNMKKLETDLGVTLFTRSSTGIKLTESGEVLLEQTRMMQRLYDNTLIRLEHIKNRQERELKIGTGHAWWIMFLRDTVNSFRQQHPGANLNVHVGNHLRLMDFLLSGDIELFIGHEIMGLSRKAEVKFLPLFTSEDMVFVRRGHPLTYKNACSLADLIEYPTMETTPNEFRHQHLIEDPQQLALHRSIHHLTEKILYTSNSLLTSIDLVSDSNALLPFAGEMSDYFSRFGLISLKLKQPYGKAMIGIYLLREMSESPHINELLTLIRKMVANKVHGTNLKED